MSSSCERKVKTPLYPVVMMSASAPEVKSDFERCRVLISRRVACAKSAKNTKKKTEFVQ